MAKVISEDVGAFYQHYPKVAAIVTAYLGNVSYVTTPKYTVRKIF